MDVHHFLVDIITEYGVKETLRISAANSSDAEAEARDIIANQRIGLEDSQCVELEVIVIDDK